MLDILCLLWLYLRIVPLIVYLQFTFIADATKQNSQVFTTLSATSSSPALLSEKSIHTVIMPSSTTTFIPDNTDSSLVSEAASQNLPQGTGSEIKENGKVTVLKIEYLRISEFYSK